MHLYPGLYTWPRFLFTEMSRREREKKKKNKVKDKANHIDEIPCRMNVFTVIKVYCNVYNYAALLLLKMSWRGGRPGGGGSE